MDNWDIKKLALIKTRSDKFGRAWTGNWKEIPRLAMQHKN